MINLYSIGHYLNLVFLLFMRLTNTGSGKWNSRSILLKYSIPTYTTIVLLMSGEVCLCSDCIPIKGPLILEGGIVDEARYNQEHNLVSKFEVSGFLYHFLIVLFIKDCHIGKVPNYIFNFQFEQSSILATFGICPQGTN